MILRTLRTIMAFLALFAPPYLPAIIPEPPLATAETEQAR